jgi:hypothetical protein
MMREVVRYVLAMVVAAGIVFPTADGVRAEGEKADRWQWVENELTSLDQFSGTVTRTLVASGADGDKGLMYRNLMKELSDTQFELSQRRPTPLALCYSDPLVTGTSEALSCQRREDDFEHLLSNVYDAYWQHCEAMSDYYYFRDALSKTNQDYFRGKADLWRNRATERLSIIRTALFSLRAQRRELLVARGLPPE